MKHNASKTRETLVRILLVAAFAVTLSLTVGRQPFRPAKQAQAKTVTAKEYNQYEHIKKIGNKKRIYFSYDVKKVKSSDTSVLTAKVTKKRQSELNVYGVIATAKKKGIAKVTVTLSNGYKDVLKYDVGGALTKVKKSDIAPKFNKKKAQKAFDIQNSYRADEGVDALEWSDELYEFAEYRLKTHGYDKHENFLSDQLDYFGKKFLDVSGSLIVVGGENMASGQKTAQQVCECWKNSSGHYANMINSNYLCGAIAYDSTHKYWVAVFSRNPASIFVDWQGQIEEYDATHATVTVRCLDSASGEYLTDTSFVYYDKDDIQVTAYEISYQNGQSGKTDTTGKKDIVLEIGKTYVLWYTFNNRVTLTVTEDCEVVLIG